MYKIWTSSKALLNVPVLSLAFTLSTSALAGPGKPGQNDIVTDPCDLAPQPLLTVLQYHVVDGRRFSNSVFNRNDSKMIETLASVDIVSFVDEVEGPTLHDADGQLVGVVDGLININAINGVIHVVDSVLLPIDLP